MSFLSFFFSFSHSYGCVVVSYGFNLPFPNYMGCVLNIPVLIVLSSNSIMSFLFVSIDFSPFNVSYCYTLLHV